MGKGVSLYRTEISQVESEIEGLIEVLVREKVQSFLEVGSRFGGSLWRIANELPKGARVVSCDSGKGMGGNHAGARESLRECVDELSKLGYDAHLVVGDSQIAETVHKVSKLRPYDAVLIDADHEYRGVKLDWKNYGQMARIVSFHDIGWEMPYGYANPKVVEVPKLWNELKQTYRHKEFIDRSTGGNMGIGVLWTS